MRRSARPIRALGAMLLVARDADAAPRRERPPQAHRTPVRAAPRRTGQGDGSCARAIGSPSSSALGVYVAAVGGAFELHVGARRLRLADRGESGGSAGVEVPLPDAVDRRLHRSQGLLHDDAHERARARSWPGSRARGAPRPSRRARVNALGPARSTPSRPTDARTTRSRSAPSWGSPEGGPRRSSTRTAATTAVPPPIRRPCGSPTAATPPTSRSGSPSARSSGSRDADAYGLASTCTVVTRRCRRCGVGGSRAAGLRVRPDADRPYRGVPTDPRPGPGHPARPDPAPAHRRCTSSTSAATTT